MHFLLLAVFVAFPTGSALSTTHQNLLPDKTLTFSSIFRSDFPICAIAVCEV
jgi:ABC-type dipeptide/oligopeptide/nickel transport system permease component